MCDIILFLKALQKIAHRLERRCLSISASSLSFPFPIMAWEWVVIKGSMGQIYVMESASVYSHVWLCGPGWVWMSARQDHKEMVTPEVVLGWLMGCGHCDCQKWYLLWHGGREWLPNVGFRGQKGTSSLWLCVSIYVGLVRPRVRVSQATIKGSDGRSSGPHKLFPSWLRSLCGQGSASHILDWVSSSLEPGPSSRQGTEAEISSPFTVNWMGGFVTWSGQWPPSISFS